MSSLIRHAAIVTALALSLFATTTVQAHPGHDFGTPFHSLSLAEACKTARMEYKLVGVYVTGPKDVPPPYLVRPSWSQWACIDLLIRECVMIRLDAARDANELRPYSLGELPAVLFLADDGRERFRVSGRLSADDLVKAVSPRMFGAEDLARIHRGLREQGEGNPLLRERLAAGLADSGEHAAALREFEWCITRGLRDPDNLLYAVARRRLLLAKFAAFARRYPPAGEALERERDNMERILLREQDSANLTYDLDELNQCLGQRDRSLSLYDRLPAGQRRARFILFDRLLDVLVERRRYREVLELADPEQTFLQDVQMARTRRHLWDDDPDSRHQRGQRDFAVARGAALVEALAATGRVKEARSLADAVIRFDPRKRTRDLLCEHARRAGSTDLVEYLRGIPS